MARGLLAVANRDRDGAIARHHVAAGEDPGWPVIMSGADHHHAVGRERDAGHVAQEAAVGLLAKRQDDRVGLTASRTARWAAAGRPRRAPSPRRSGRRRRFP